MKKIISVLTIILLVAVVVLIGSFGVMSKGFKDFSFLHLDQGEPTDPGDVDEPTNPGDVDDPIEPGDADKDTDDPDVNDQCVHEYAWEEERVADPYTTVYMSSRGLNVPMPEGFDDFAAGYKIEISVDDVSHVFYMLAKDENVDDMGILIKDDFYIVDEGNSILAYIENFSQASAQGQILFKLSSSLRIVGIDYEITPEAFVQFIVTYSVKGKECIKCGKSSNDLLNPDGDPNANIEVKDINFVCTDAMIHDDDWDVDVYCCSSDTFNLHLTFDGKLKGMRPEDLDLTYKFESELHGVPLFMLNDTSNSVEGEFFCEYPFENLLLWNTVTSEKISEINILGAYAIEVRFLKLSFGEDCSFFGFKEGKIAYCTLTVKDEISGCRASINLRIPEEIFYE